VALDPSQSNSETRYTFTVPTADLYVIWGHVRPSATGTSSFFITLDSGAASSVGGRAGTVTDVVPQHYEVAPNNSKNSTEATLLTLPDYAVWTLPSNADLCMWDQAASDNSPVFFLEPSEYTLIIKQRESGNQLDQLPVITNNIEYQS
jgi:hypothetical protein